MLAALWTIVTLLCVLVIVLTVMVVGLMRRVLPALERAETVLASGGPSVIEGLPVGATVPPLRGE